MSKFTALPNVQEIAEQYDGFILDLWGVLHDGIHAFPDVPETLKRVKAAGIRTCLLSNAPFKSETVINKMIKMGITRDMYDEIVTSGQATRDALVEFTDPFFAGVTGKKVYIIEPGKYDCILEDLDGVTHVSSIEEADIVIAAGFDNFTHTLEDCIETLKKALARNLPMICSNPDLEVIEGGKHVICAGSFAKWYEEHGGQTCYYGKPHSRVYNAALKKLAIADKSRILAFGDGMHTDVAGANKAGLDVALVSTGIHVNDLCHKDGSFPNMEKATALIEERGDTPTYIIKKFSWA